MSNDFTKEELVFLMRLMTNQFLDTLPIADKIQSMIDNYCEHKNKCVNGAKLVCEDCEKEW